MNNNNIELSNASTLDDIVFEQRNKSYGAFLLRKLYDKNVLLALVISISFFSMLLAIPLIAKYFAPKEIIVVEEKKPDVKIIDVPLDPKEVKAIPVEPPPPPEIKQVKFIAFEPAPDKEVKEKINFKIDSANVSTINKDGKDTIMDLPPAVEIGSGVLPSDDEGTWLGSVSKEASFPGGQAALNKYIQSHLSDRVRNFISDRGIKGKIYISIEVKKDGSLTNVMVTPGRDLPNCKICGENLVEIIQNGPKWAPAENNGNSVNRKATIPVVF
jgi:protein TonB